MCQISHIHITNANINNPDEANISGELASSATTNVNLNNVMVEVLASATVTGTSDAAVASDRAETER